MSVTLGGMLVVAVVFIAVGSAGFDKLIEMDLKANLPARMVEALEDLDHKKVPSREDMAEILKLSAAEEPRLIFLSYSGVAVLGLAVIVVCVMVAVLFARQVADSLNEVAAGAARMAKGDFAYRIAPQPRQTQEIQSLIASFNAQAEALERSDRQMRFHTAAIAHELRTPLTVLRGYVHGALDGLFVRDDAHMRALLIQVEDLSRLVDDLRTASLASSGVLSLELRPCDLAAEARTVLDIASPQLEAAGLAVESRLGEALAHADPGRVRQMLLAVLDNARRHAADGRWISVRTERLEDASILQVADRGPGFPEGSEALVFERFWRADPSRARSTGGSGLGLSVVKALADAHGGHVEILNRRGGGALVELRFPHPPASPRP